MRSFKKVRQIEGDSASARLFPFLKYFAKSLSNICLFQILDESIFPCGPFYLWSNLLWEKYISKFAAKNSEQLLYIQPRRFLSSWKFHWASCDKWFESHQLGIGIISWQRKVGKSDWRKNFPTEQFSCQSTIYELFLWSFSTCDASAWWTFEKFIRRPFRTLTCLS